MTFFDRTLAAMRRWPILMAGLVIGAIVGFLFSQLSPAGYSSDAKVLVTVTGKQSASDMSSAAIYAASQMSSYESAATSQTVLDPVIAKLKLDTTASELAKQVTATAVTEGYVLDITVKDSSAQRAADIANAIAFQMSEVVKDLTPLNEDGTKPLTSRVLETAIPDTTGPATALGRNVIGLSVIGLLLAAALVMLLEARLQPRQAGDAVGGASTDR